MKNATLCIAVLALFGCEWLSDPIEEADTRIERFHDRYNAGDLSSIRADASRDFDSQQDLERMSLELGGIIRSDLSHATGSQGCSGTSVQTVLRTEFDHGIVYEEFTYVYQDGDYRLLDYRHLPPDQVKPGVVGIF